MTFQRVYWGIKRSLSLNVITQKYGIYGSCRYCWRIGALYVTGGSPFPRQSLCFLLSKVKARLEFFGKIFFYVQINYIGILNEPICIDYLV